MWVPVLNHDTEGSKFIPCEIYRIHYEAPWYYIFRASSQLFKFLAVEWLWRVRLFIKLKEIEREVELEREVHGPPIFPKICHEVWSEPKLILNMLGVEVAYMCGTTYDDIILTIERVAQPLPPPLLHAGNVRMCRRVGGGCSRKIVMHVLLLQPYFFVFVILRLSSSCFY